MRVMSFQHERYTSGLKPTVHRQPGRLKPVPDSFQSRSLDVKGVNVSHSSGQFSQKNRIMPVARRGIDKNAVLSSRNRRRTLGGHMSGGIKRHKNFASIIHSSFFPKGVPAIVHYGISFPQRCTHTHREHYLLPRAKLPARQIRSFPDLGWPTAYRIKRYSADRNHTVRAG